MKSRGWIPAILAVALVAGLLAGCGGAKNDELVVGVYGSLTGNDATFGQSTRDGAELAHLATAHGLRPLSTGERRLSLSDALVWGYAKGG